MIKAALFDLDGVVLDTETQYSVFWGMIGKEYHPELPDFALRIKGQTLGKSTINIFPMMPSSPMWKTIRA